MKPKISIILPIYNVEQYLDYCLDTISGQTIKEIEIICVIDNSPDRSIDICRKFQQKDSRVKIIDKPVNEGLGYTRNAGLSEAQGEFVAFVDSDDYIDLRMYEELYSFAKGHRLDACWCNYRYDLGGRYSESREMKESFVKDSPEGCKEYMLDMLAPLPEYKSDVKHLVSAWRAIYSRELIEKHGIRFESERDNGSEDIPFNMDFLLRASRIGYIPYVGYNYRYNPVSLSRNYTHQKFHAYEHLFDEVRDRLDMHFGKKEYILHYQRFIFYFFRNIIKYEAIKNINGECFKNIRMRCDDERLKPIYETYPYTRLPLKQRVFFFCMKHKCVLAIYLMCLLENKIRKNV